MMEKDFDIEVYLPEKRAEDNSELNALKAAIESLRNQAKYTILESLTEIAFPKPAEWEVNLAQWPKGRLFSPHFELRWEKLSDGYHAVFVRELSFDVPEPVAKYFSQQVSKLQEEFRESKETSFYLWSEKETRLGRRLHYQCLDSKRDDNRQNVKLRVRQYYDIHGCLIFWRFKQMEWSA